MDLVSIIVPIYNVEKYLEVCIKSIIEQTYSNVEIILIDDGSSDNSGYICDEWAKKDERVNVIHKQNGGLSDARNVGKQYANGEYFVFVDGDDYIAPTLVSYCYESAKRYEVDIVVYEWYRVEEEYNELYKDTINPSIERMKGSDLLREFVLNEKGHATICNKFYKREIWDGIDFPVGKLHEDEYVITDILLKAKNIIVSDNRLYYYRKRNRSITNVFNKKSFYDTLEAIGERCKKLKYDEELYSVTLNLYLVQIIKIYKIEQKKEKKKLLKDFRKNFNISMKYLYWKTRVLYIVFYINPKIFLLITKIFSVK